MTGLASVMEEAVNILVDAGFIFAISHNFYSFIRSWCISCFREMFSFVLTNELGMRQYGYCRRLLVIAIFIFQNTQVSGV